jgi:hypothetical protein
MTYLTIQEFSDQFDELWDGLVSEFFKLETLQHYSEIDNPAYQALVDGNLEQAIQKISALIIEGEESNSPSQDFNFKRVRVVTWPLTDYTFWEFHAYALQEKINEPVFIVEKDNLQLVLCHV